MIRHILVHDKEDVKDKNLEKKEKEKEMIMNAVFNINFIIVLKNVTK